MTSCKNCGKENPKEARFCGNCGTALNTDRWSCATCGKTLEESEKFCSSCGTPVKKDQPEPPPPPPTPPQPKKKKKGCLGCFLKGLIILIILMAGGILVIYYTTDWFDEIEEEWNKIRVENFGTGTETTSPEANAPASAPIEAPSGKINIQEIKNIKAIAGAVEEVFEKSDTTALKMLLTATSAEKYRGVYAEIRPYMNAYAQAFKKRTLIRSNAFYAVYSFKDEAGTYSAEFALAEDGNWKLVRF